MRCRICGADSENPNSRCCTDRKSKPTEPVKVERDAKLLTRADLIDESALQHQHHFNKSNVSFRMGALWADANPATRVSELADKIASVKWHLEDILGVLNDHGQETNSAWLKAKVTEMLERLGL